MFKKISLLYEGNDNERKRDMKFKLSKMILVLAVVLSAILPTTISINAVENVEYEIYPIPQLLNYKNTTTVLREKINVVYESGIDEYTKNRMNEVALLKNIPVSVSDEVVENATNVLIGINGSEEYVDNYAKNNMNLNDSSLFSKLDAYLMDIDNGIITIVGKDTDSAFYGLTTLYMILNQIDEYSIRDLYIEDYADVASRGFIEGYYGNPWSTEDRINLMEWGGYYKLNSYFYAPKDDPKHNAEWRSLYTEEELQTLIKPLSDAGNASKCRFVYALHPFMKNEISFNSEAEYQADLNVLKAKFEQVIQSGVRQIAILADDASNFNNTGNLGGNNYERLLRDMSAWLIEIQKTYPDMKTTLPFCPVEYGDDGLPYYSNFPDNVQIIMTGGKVWGEVSDSYTTTFTNIVGRGPYMWINWPCTDNSKNHLIMAGYSTFLQPNVDPSNIQGIVLNPMQQSEPSKVAIFGNACYSWNIWDSEEEANAAWDASFDYVDHNSSLSTESSLALKELSKHMINQNMDGRVTPLEESVELAPLLNDFKNKLKTEAVTLEDVDKVIAEFEILQEAADIYRKNAGNIKTLNQMIYWIDCWDDTTAAAIAYLNGIKASIEQDENNVISYNAKGATAFASSKTHRFFYVDHYENAEVGVQHIVPFINELSTYLATKVETILTPDSLIYTFITNRNDNPIGNISNVFDGDDSTFVSYQNPVWLYKNDYVGVTFNKVIEIENIRFLLGNGKNHIENAKMQYTLNGSDWFDIEFVNMDNTFDGVRNSYQDINITSDNLPTDFEAKGIRLIATENNKLDAYLDVYEIEVNKEKDEDKPVIVSGEYSTNREKMNNSSFEVLNDGNNGNSDASEIWLSSSSGDYKDKLEAGSYVQYTFNKEQLISSVVFAQGGSNSGDSIDVGELQYLDDYGAWQKVADVNSNTVQEFDLSANNIYTTAMRIINTADKNIWWRVGEFNVIVTSTEEADIEYNVIKSNHWGIYEGSEASLYDGNDSTYVWYNPGVAALLNDYIGYDLGNVISLQSAHIVVGAGDADKFVNYTIETSLDNITWEAVEGYDAYKGVESGKDTLNIDLNGKKVRYIRIRNLENRNKWVKFSEFTVEKVSIGGSSENVFTNVATSITSNLKTAGEASLSSETLTLNKDDYIGIKLNNIKTITSINTSKLSSNLILETSLNSLIWNEYNANEEIDARYIRIRSTSDANKFTLSEFKVIYDYIGEYQVDSNFANGDNKTDMRTNDTVDNVFDGDLITSSMINGVQEKGKHITFDLGQILPFKSIRYYVIETSLNYLRDADFEVSTDGQTWTKVLHVGQEVKNEWNDSVAKDMQDITLMHDSSNPGYMYAEATGLDVEGRYIRVTPTSTYSHRWVEFAEIMINNGEYFSKEANRDIVSTDIEEKGKIPSNMLDNNFTSCYKSSETNSSFTYFVSMPMEVTSLYLIQNSEISNANVTAKVMKKDGSADIQEINLGKLSLAINEFLLPKDCYLLEVNVSWKDVIPEISEIMISDKALKAVDKSQLENEIKIGASSEWTDSSVDAYNTALEVAKDILANEYISQTSVDAALSSLRSTYKNAVLKATNISELQDLVANKLINNDNTYTSFTYADYEAKINNIAIALKDANNISLDKGITLFDKANTAIAALKYSSRNRELAKFMLDGEVTLTEEEYTKKSWKIFESAKTALLNGITKDEAATNKDDRVLPSEIKTFTKAYSEALDSLVSIKSLKVLIGEFASIDSTLYTQDSYQTYKDAIDAAELLLTDGTEAEIAEAEDQIITAKNALILVKDDTLSEVIKDAEKVLEGAEDKYTKASYQNLKNAINEAKNAGAEADSKKLSEAIIKAKNDLVDVTLLRDAIASMNNLDRNSYTISSYAKIDELITESNQLFENGSGTAISEMIKNLDTAKRNLVIRISEQIYSEYLNSIELKDSKWYTDASYKAYKSAYDFLCSLNLEDTSVTAYYDAINEFEAAEANLALKEVINNTETGSNTGDTTNTGLWITLMLGAGALLVIRKRNMKA